ncbi:class F sortase [Arthrobacter sp. MAHUQ-56]
MTGPGPVPQAGDIIEASPPTHLSYPAAAIDVQVHVLEPDEHALATRSLVPPKTRDGYWLAPFGAPGAGSTNTTYIVGHSWVGQDAPFNHLGTAAAPGDRLTLLTATGSVDYQVDRVTAHSKWTLRDSDIWKVVPNRLVLISCHTDDPWGTNIVVVASPVGT